MLPIEPLLPALRDALTAHRSVVLQAPPGAGKTTLVPLALLEERWLGDASIVMLEPRRIAARAAAARLAALHGDRVGDTIGYRMRGESRVGSRTRIEVVTEGVLARRIERDPTLDGVGLLIFDEFHERSLDADLGLALALRSQSLLRDDLRLLVMSATLDGDAVARLLGGAPILTSEGRGYPIETRYVPPRGDVKIESAVASVIRAALRDSTVGGDVLVFLPGAAEIRRVEALLAERDLDGALVTPLFGALPADAQDRAIFGDGSARRRVILSTSIAETSLTIEGVRTVVDSGLARVPRFSPATGMTRLETVRVSRASADQRRGRAGRLAPGICYRLWAEHETHGLLASTPAEITSADLAPLALDLAAAGASDPRELAWIDPPSPAAFARARELLYELGALDASDERGRLTEHGRAMSVLPVHPRLAHMLLSAARAGAITLASELAALLSERDMLRSSGPAPIDADISLRVDALRREGSAPGGAFVDRDVVRRARAEADRLARQLRAERVARSEMPDGIGALLALAYPDRVAQRRPGERARFVLRNGRGAELLGNQSLSQSPYIVAAELDDRRPESRIFLAAPLALGDLRALFADQIVTEDVVAFDDEAAAIVARRRERLGAIVLRDAVLPQPDEEQALIILLDTLRRRGAAALPWSDAAARTRRRIAFIAAHEPAWPDVSDAALTASMEQWLAPSLRGVRRLADLDRVDLAAALTALLDWRQRRALDELAPSHIEVPSGSRIAVDYSDPDAPSLAVRIQEVFGLAESPRVLAGRIPVTMELLSPAHRPVQVTRDLAGFWRTSYFDVRKDLRGRYPKHEWPEDPMNATPTRRAKPRR